MREHAGAFRRFFFNLSNDPISKSGLLLHYDQAVDAVPGVDIAAADPRTATVTLQPGQRYDYRSRQAEVLDIGASAENALGWRNGLINFDDQPLSEAATIMNRYSVDQLIINDPAVAAMRVSGQFRAGDIVRFAETLADVHRLRTVRKDGQVELLRSN